MDILHWKEIPCVMLRLDSVLAGEYAENEFRKQFTASERAAIGSAIEDELGHRKPGPKPSAIAEQLPKGNSIDLAAKRAGFTSAETFERARTVVDKGTPDLVKAMDEKKVSISAAAAIAAQPKQEQTRILAMEKPDRDEVLRQIRKAKADREANERRARDLRVYWTLHKAVEYIAGFCDAPLDAWAGLARVSAFDFSKNLPRAIKALVTLEKEHPNERRKPEILAKKAN